MIGINLEQKTRLCSRCAEWKPFDAFIKDKSRKLGIGSWCLRCEKIRWFEDHRRRVSDPDYIRRKQEARKRYNDSHPNRNRISSDPTRTAARLKLTRAVRAGRVLKPAACEGCSVDMPAAKLHGHHTDYSSPLNVRWLCQECHAFEHRAPGPNLVGVL